MCPERTRTEVARSEGFEPPTPRFEVWCSIQLSYERLRLGRNRMAPIAGTGSAAAAYKRPLNLEEMPPTTR
jgi:hypothetical protein